MRCVACIRSPVADHFERREWNTDCGGLMTSVVAFEDAKSAQKTRRGTTRTPFLGSVDTPELPFAFLSQGDPNRVIRPHWHIVDQFQVIVEGSGSLGRHEVAPYS